MSLEKISSSPETVVVVGSEVEVQTPQVGITRSWSMGSYPKLSNLMGTWPEVAIFRRFGSLNAQNLLFLQAEITHLETELRDLRAEEEEKQDLKGIAAQRNWFELSRGLDEDDEPSEQWDIIQKIRVKLREYNESLLQYKELCALQNPTKHDLKTLRLWLEHREYGDNFLRGVERDIFHIDDPNDPNCDDRSSDLVTVSHEAVEKDYFSRWVSDELIGRFHNLIGHRWKRPVDPETGICNYRKTHVRALSHLVGVVLASVIPAASIFTLYFVNNMVDRLGVLLAYSALFSICLAIFTTARRVEIFAATAAYVTFLSVLALSWNP
ncbi:uncharacterized protein A1O5_01289 [Cladophialophora psammophila CBS 110553]|uniref:DUF6594 domain-containing protein n=1 Tax=Cladophialophora psammophila CBS 110553 TaxID=1182543 RepID=W9XIJ6_9EURO|nr:uncharacterized protein A1O5_01289 [Cladophialophora psammophila CBS 110553]EXJ76781.1 hypothetical protein A1O5_01289 [Cladophialophora psammophila CBS 110553]